MILLQKFPILHNILFLKSFIYLFILCFRNNRSKIAIAMAAIIKNEGTTDSLSPLQRRQQQKAIQPPPIIIPTPQEEVAAEEFASEEATPEPGSGYLKRLHEKCR